MEQRGGDQRRGDRRFGRDCRAAAPLGRHAARHAGIEQVHQVGDAAPVGQLRALGVAGGAAGVEDAGIGIGIDIDLWHCARVGDHIGPGDLAGGGVGPHGNGRHLGGRAGAFSQARQPFGIGEDRLRRRIGQRIVQLLAGPPGVGADGGHTQAQAGPVDDHPFRIIAHGDRHPIARPHALVPQPGGHGADLVVRLGVSHALTFIDQVIARAEGGGGQPEGTGIGRGVLVDLQRLAQHFGLDDFEGAARAGQFLAYLAQLCVMHASSHGWF